MSIGYETQIPPINTLAFYNAIANNGVMVKPRFVKSIVKDGQVVEDIAPEILNPAIASPQGYQRDTNNFGKKLSAKGWERKQDPSNSMYPGKPVLHRFHKGKPDTLMAHAVIW